ncbi:MAG: YegS/Rv2252/BmrU family lipid kinase [Rikenellaceae bacterium]|nr:YegS/Rv2252/BmrU family lipid kinase [Rikenellaceae bacterium]MDE7356390.1 YegS/Rv2252/BmrU family lipid kinase [Rikenellaceae bacterium]
MKRVCFIYNPMSGEKKARTHLDYIVKCYQKHGYLLDLYRIGRDSDIDGVMSELTPDHQRILAAGGDGTINTVVGAMKRTGTDLPLAVLPTGTANDFAAMLGYSTNLKEAIKQSASGIERSVDIGKCGDRYFVNVLSAGLFTDISQKTPTVLKNTFGKIAYYLTSSINSLHELPKFKPIHIDIESEQERFDGQSVVFFVFNGRTAGNMKLAYRSDIDDGLLDVIVVKADRIGDTLRTVLHVLSQQIADVNTGYPKGVLYFQTRSLKLSGREPVVVDIDGETGPETPFEITCLPKDLRVIVPEGSFSPLSLPTH